MCKFLKTPYRTNCPAFNVKSNIQAGYLPQGGAMSIVERQAQAFSLAQGGQVLHRSDVEWSSLLPFL